jgi:hypothetical protein
MVGQEADPPNAPAYVSLDPRFRGDERRGVRGNLLQKRALKPQTCIAPLAWPGGLNR